MDPFTAAFGPYFASLVEAYPVFFVVCAAGLLALLVKPTNVRGYVACGGGGIAFTLFLWLVLVP